MNGSKIQPAVVTLSTSLDPAALEVLADVVCGNDQDKFPKYRSSYYITQFFQQIDIDVRHDGSARKTWVLDVLINLSPSDLEKVIKRLADPREYKGEPELIKKATSELNRALGLEGLAIRHRKQGPVIVELHPADQKRAPRAEAAVSNEGVKEEKHVYYSQRKGGDSAQGYDNAGLLAIIKNDMQTLVAKGYFNEHLGMNLQQGLVRDVRLALIKETGKSNLSLYVPTFEHFTIRDSLDDFFDIIEFLYRNVSKPNEDTITTIDSLYKSSTV